MTGKIWNSVILGIFSFFFISANSFGAGLTYYSYQTGPWQQASTWTFDPGGTTGPGTLVPGTGDNVVILTGRTVTLQANETSSNLSIIINNGGILDLASFKFTNTLSLLKGGGILKLSSSNFPAATVNTFVTTDGGTAEYGVNGVMSATQTSYYHLSINSAGTVIQVSNISLKGNLTVKKGTFQINDATNRRLQLIINGDVNVNSTGSITVGTGTTNSQASPLGITGNTGTFLNYYELQSHRVQIYGDFTNDGIVKFSNLTYPVYNQLPANGFATVYFQGSSDRNLKCNGQTDFYNLVVDKGVDQTFKLTVYSAAYNYFRLFGANISDGSITLPVSPAGNPNLKKALWIKNGTLVLQGLVVIPSLTEGNTAGTYPSHFFIPANGSLLLDGAGVIVSSTADDFAEVNAAYGLSGGSNAIYGINTTGGYSGLSILGKFQVNNGYFSTRESAGILYWSYAPGQFILNGGVVDSKQFHNPEGGAIGLISYLQSGGSLLLRGRFKTNIAFVNPADLANASINTSRIANNIDAGAAIGTLNISSNAANAFTMSGGTLTVYDVCNTTATSLAFVVSCPVSNINVTGGTVQILPTTGTSLADANYLINSTANFYNLLINMVSGSSSVQLNTNPLIVLNNLTLFSGVLISNNLDVKIGGDFNIENGTTYTPGTNTTVFNGAGSQTFKVNLGSPLTLNKLTVDKPTSSVLNFSGTQNIINVNSDFRLALGTLNDNGNSLNIAGNIYNSGIHTGNGRIVLNGTLPQSIDGNGIFTNLELNNTNAAAAPVSLAANMTIKGQLIFSQNRNFNINTFNLNIKSTGTIVNAGPLAYIKTSGNAGDGGLTREFSMPSTFIFPVGVVNYTPGSIGLNSAPISYGTITVVPVNFAHPNVTTAGRSLTYFWRTRSSGFNLGTATVTMGYTYDQSNFVTGSGITEDEYVVARFNPTTSTWSKGNSSDVDETNNIIGEPGAGTFLENVGYIDGDYTAGDDNPTNPFGIPQTYYSRINGAAAGSGPWSSVNTWSTDPVLKHSGAPAGSVPGISDIVIIGANDSVYLATNNTTPNTDVRSCASLKIEKGSALDIGFNYNSSFGLVLNHANGNGNFRLTTSYTDGSTFTFPSGDFSVFNVNLGTTELYSTNSAAGTTYWLPNGVLSYGNLILSPLGGSNIIFPNNDLTIYGNLVTKGQNADSWFCPAWTSNYPTAPTVRIAKTITINGNLDIQSGALIWYGNAAITQNFVVNGDVKVGTQAAMYVYGSATSQNIAIGGSLINNADGIAHVGTISKVDFTNLPVTFFGPNSASITNTIGSPLTIFANVIVNKGNSPETTLTCNIGGTLTTLANAWLTLQNGTFRYMRTDPSTDFTISTTTAFSIPATAGLTINLPGNAGNKNILIGNINNNTGDLLLSGKLTIVNGNVYIGRITGTDANNNDIEYTSSGASAIEVQGGKLFVNGQIRRNPLNAGGFLKYIQSGGTVIVNGQASNTTNAKLEVLNEGSEFTMSNGTLNIVRGNGSTTTSSTPFGDLYIRPEKGSITGGTIVFSQGASVAQNYFLDSNIPLNNLTITGIAGQPATVRLLVSPLVINGNVTISASSVLNSNNISVTFNGNLINTPGLSGYVAGTNLTTFSASNDSPVIGVQSITGATNFYDLVVNSGTSLDISNPSNISNSLKLNSGSFNLGANSASIQGDFENNARYSDNNSVGSGIILNGTSLQHINGFGAYARLTLNNAAGAQIENDITFQEDLTLTTGILNIKKTLVSLGVNSNIQGAPFSSSKMIVTDGVFSNVGLRKFFNSGASAFLYPIGTSSKYTPALLTINASNTVGFVRINNINSKHPVVVDPSNALNYYWEVQSSGITGFSGTLKLNYLQADVAGDESNYLSARLMVPGTSWSLTSGVDQSLNIDSINFVGSNNLSGEYTAGISSAFPLSVPIYTSNRDGSWSDNTIWDQTGGDPFPCPVGGPNGFIVVVNHVVKINTNKCSAYRTTINKELQIISPTYGHNLGTVDGNGRLHLENGTFPAGVFTTFLSCANNSTLEYAGSGIYTIIADLYDQIPNLEFTGTGTRILPDKNLTVCTKLVINGPALDNSIYNRKLSIEGTMERYGTGSFVSGTGSNATVSFTGSNAQVIGGVLGNFSGTNSFNNFEINNSSGLTINTGGAIEAKSNLLLTNGLINTSGLETLTISNPAINCVIPSGGSSSSFVNGPLIKKINQYDSFYFPIGIYKAGVGNIPGNNLTISSTQTGPLYWSAEYKNPNLTFGSLTTPLLAVSAQEFYRIKVGAGNRSVIGINWTPISDVTPLTAGGLSNIRLANYSVGTSKWVEISTTATGTDSNGKASSAVLLNSTGSDDYALASITDLKPKAKLAPTGPICGTSGIPVTFTAPFSIPFNYLLSYSINGIVQAPVTITPAMIPYTLPTTTSGSYLLSGFTYNNGAGVGVVDETVITVNPVPTTADAGLDQTYCGITTTFLNGNAPVVGTGLWSIVSGAGGTIITPTNRTSQFIGLNGTSYTLRWTITSGTCKSMDNVNINFTILPDSPTAVTSQTLCQGTKISAISVTPPVGCTVDWYDNPTGGTLYAVNTVLIAGTAYYGESNGGGGCMSLSRTPVTISLTPSVTINPFTPATSTRCQGSNTVISITSASNSTGITYTLDAASIAAGNSIIAGTGAVTYAAGWSGTSTITASAEGCNGPATTTLVVTTTPTVTITSYSPATSSRCQGSGTLTKTTTASNSTGLTYSLDAASISGGNTINSATGTVNFDAIWNGVSVITASATGCNGPVTTNHTVTVNPLPVLSISAMPDVCVDALDFNLTQGSPIGGIYSGPGITASPLFSPVAAGIGTHTITYTYTDGNGCTNSIVQNITVNALPVVSFSAVASVCPNAAAFNLTQGTPVGGVYSGSGIATSPLFNPSVSGTGTHTINYLYTDGNGCSNNANQTITVIDNTAPKAVCQNKTINLDATGNASITAAMINNGSTDNCTAVGALTLSLSKTTFDCTNLGANTVTLTVTDGSGNASTCTSTVTVIDNTAPTAVCQNKTINLDATGNASITAAMINNGSTDNCTAVGALTLSLSKTTFDCTNLGANTVTLTVTDGSGNASTCTSTVTVVDNTAPTAVCQNKTINLDATGNASITAAMINNGSTDNCTAAGALILALSKTNFDCTNLGANTVTLTVTDGSGNASTCTSTVTVVDNTAPTAVCQNKTINLDATGNATITAAMINNGSTDNCTAAGALILALSKTNFDCTNLGANTVTLTVTDGSGNASTCTSTVTVIDNLAPTAICQNKTINLDATGNASITAAMINNGSTDNCTAAGALTLALSKTNFDCTNLGANTVTLTVTDGSGNASTCTSTVTVIHDTPPASASVDRNNVCAADGNIILTYAGGTLGAGSSAEWYSDAAFAIHAGSGNNLVLPAPLSTTSYFVRFEGICGNSTSVNVTININPLPHPVVSGSTEVCEPALENYSVASLMGHSYNWTVSGGVISGASDTSSVLVNWVGIGTGWLQIVEVIDATGCQQTTPLYNITKFETPVLPDIESDNKIIRR